MKRAKNRVLAALLLAMIALGAAIAASFTAPAGWLVLSAFIVGAACSWLLFRALVGYGKQQARQRLTAALARQQQTAHLVKLIRQNRANTTEETEP